MIRKIALAAALCVAGSATAQATTYNIALDGFCNTFTLYVNGFEVSGTRGGCGYTDIDGGSVGKVGSKYIISNDTNDSAEIFTWYFTPPKHNAGSWYLYESTGGTSQTEVNSGTYTSTKSGAAAGVRNAGKDATAR
jgi:hypothetical protein